MRFRARLVLGLYGVALAVPAVVMAGPFGDDEAMPGKTVVQAPAQATSEHHHKGLLGRRHCVECQRAYAKWHDGVDIPAPPPIVTTDTHGRVINNGVPCPTCQGNGMAGQDPNAPGYAVAGGPDAPGYAVIGETFAGTEPTPVGVAKARQGNMANARMAANGGRAGAGPVDPSVVPTNLAPAPEPIAGAGHYRPRIVTTLFGLPNFGRAWRDRQDQERQKHASIAYGQNDQKVTDLPASVVYKH
jgi:hypothetical protein